MVNDHDRPIMGRNLFPLSISIHDSAEVPVFRKMLQHTCRCSAAVPCPPTFSKSRSSVSETTASCLVTPWASRPGNLLDP